MILVPYKLVYTKTEVKLPNVIILNRYILFFVFIHEKVLKKVRKEVLQVVLDDFLAIYIRFMVFQFFKIELKPLYLGVSII